MPNIMRNEKVWHSFYLLVSQCFPSKPALHVHLNEFTLSVQLPSFWQGKDLHSSISRVKKKIRKYFISRYNFYSVKMWCQRGTLWCQNKKARTIYYGEYIMVYTCVIRLFFFHELWRFITLNELVWLTVRVKIEAKHDGHGGPGTFRFRKSIFVRWCSRDSKKRV